MRRPTTRINPAPGKKYRTRSYCLGLYLYLALPALRSRAVNSRAKLYYIAYIPVITTSSLVLRLGPVNWFALQALSVQAPFHPLCSQCRLRQKSAIRIGLSPARLLSLHSRAVLEDCAYHRSQLLAIV